MVNTTIITNSTENVVIAVVQGINTESGGAFGFMLLLSVYLIIFFPSLARFGTRGAFGSAAFVGGLAAVLLRIVGLINDAVLLGAIVLTVLAVVVLYMSRGE